MQLPRSRALLSLHLNTNVLYHVTLKSFRASVCACIRLKSVSSNGRSHSTCVLGTVVASTGFTDVMYVQSTPDITNTIVQEN